MKNRMCALTTVAVMLLVSSALPATAQTTCNIAPSISTAVLDWLTQHVCSVSGVVQNTDPCSCPTSGGSLARLTVGESLPYHKWDQTGTVLHDSFITQTLLTEAWDSTNNYRVINTEGTNYLPQGDTSTYFSGLNNYTVYRSDNLYGEGATEFATNDWSTNFSSGDYWASSDGTKDAGNFGASLWGCPDTTDLSECFPYGGWLFFDGTFLTNMKNGTLSTCTLSSVGCEEQTSYEGDSQWEHNSEYFPGTAPTAATSPSNYISHLTGLNYGGPSTSTQKIIQDSIQAIHGNIINDDKDHLEILYFTQLYGWTRWESWRPTQQWSTVDPGSPTGETYGYEAINDTEPVCSAMAATTGFTETLNTSGTYNGAITTSSLQGQSGNTFFLAGCTDDTEINTTGDSYPAAWPVPEMNLLSNPHFTTTGGSYGGCNTVNGTQDWSCAGSPNFDVVVSDLEGDNESYDYVSDGWNSLCSGGSCAGVDYATLQAGQSSGQYVCAGSTTGTCSIYSDIALPSAMTSGNTYWIDFGAIAAIDNGSPVTSGSLTLIVDQLHCTGADTGCTFISGTAVGPFTSSITTQVYATDPSTPPAGSVVLDSQLAGPSASKTSCGTCTAVNVTEPQQITVASTANYLRLSIQFQPQSGVIFDIPEAWLQYVPDNGD